VKPICLFADSSLLFWQAAGFFLGASSNSSEPAPAKAAYIGASNGDKPEFYSIFTAAMEGLGVHNYRMIRSSFSKEDVAFIDEADIILLAGGDVERGWNVFSKNGLPDILIRRYKEGTTLIGVSAGAVQLGSFGMRVGALSAENLIPMLGLVPFIIGVHEEREEWARLKQTIRLATPKAKGIGIPHGAGMILHIDGSIEPIKSPLYEFSTRGEEIVSKLLTDRKRTICGGTARSPI
jgi:cyanophycinase